MRGPLPKDLSRMAGDHRRRRRAASLTGRGRMRQQPTILARALTSPLYSLRTLQSRMDEIATKTHLRKSAIRTQRGTRGFEPLKTITAILNPDTDATY